MPKIGVKEIFREGGPYDKLLDHILLPTQTDPGSVKGTMYVGIDPGAEGGFAVIHPDSGWIDVSPMPETLHLQLYWLANRIGFEGARGWQVRGVIEEVYSSPQMGVASAFSFGGSYGSLQMILVACGVPYETVRPQVWQKEFSIPHREKGTKINSVNKNGKPVVREVGGESQNDFKKRILKYAHRLFPDVPLWGEPKSLGRQLSVCDALLLAEFCRRKHASHQT